MNRTQYQNPLISRYAGKEMSYVFSDENKFRTWRKCWVALAEAQQELCLKIDGKVITEEQINELKSYADNINYEVSEQKEKELRHDVLSHIYAYGEQCKSARSIIHLGVTSCFVTDNTELIQIKQAFKLVQLKLVSVIRLLRNFAWEYRRQPTVGFTHLQPAQLTTVGLRASLWLQDLVIDFQRVEIRLANYKSRGAKGAVGTQASFLSLFDGDEAKVKKLDELVAKKLGFMETFSVTGQTYPRKIDTINLNVLQGIAESASKFGSDIRHLQFMEELEEPFEVEQRGSSAMPHKRNPMRSERMGSLSRYNLVSPTISAFTSASQWFERTLDDSAIRRIVIPEAFLVTDGILSLYINILQGLKVYPKVMQKHLEEKLPLLATQNMVGAAVGKGADRQEMHRIISEHAYEVVRAWREDGEVIDLLARISKDDKFPLKMQELREMLKVEKLIGRAPGLVEEFIEREVDPILEKYSEASEVAAEVMV